MVYTNLRHIKYFSKSSYKLKFEKKSVKEKYIAGVDLVKNLSQTILDKYSTFPQLQRFSYLSEVRARGLFNLGKSIWTIEVGIT